MPFTPRHGQSSKVTAIRSRARPMMGPALPIAAGGCDGFRRNVARCAVPIDGPSATASAIPERGSSLRDILRNFEKRSEPQSERRTLPGKKTGEDGTGGERAGIARACSAESLVRASRLERVEIFSIRWMTLEQRLHYCGGPAGDHRRETANSCPCPAPPNEPRDSLFSFLRAWPCAGQPTAPRRTPPLGARPR